MNRDEKSQIIDLLQEEIAKCDIGILTDYRGLTAAEINDLRNKLRAAGVDYKVVKNSLAQFAAERAGRKEISGLFEGPVAIAFGHGDVTVSAKALADYIRTSKIKLDIKGGFLDTGLLTSKNVEALATLPSREVLISQVLAGMQSPIVTLISQLAAPMRGMVGVLQARIQQLEGE